tara:strand:- start:7785 stop:8564 length:780 start_codon:yes stop_codon:yes gene_type:complete
MYDDLLNKTALVCGSTQGIGLSIAKNFAENGVNLILVSRDKLKLQKIISDLPNKKKHTFVVCDFNNPDKLEKKISALVKKNKIHVLINNTGGPASGSILKATTKEFLDGFKMHIICNQILVKHVLPGMKKLKYGRIINIISTSVKAPIQDLGVSNTIRGAVANWSKTLANEIGCYGITVNNVLPGYTNTNRLQSLIEKKAKKTGKQIKLIKKNMIQNIPAQRFGEPEEIAYLVSFLSSSKASYINGTNIVVDGGRTASL